MENMWLMAQDLGIGYHILSVFGGGSVEEEMKRILMIPEYMKIAYAVRLGYSVSQPPKYPRVRRSIGDFAFCNQFGKSIDQSRISRSLTAWSSIDCRPLPVSRFAFSSKTTCAALGLIVLST